MTIVRASLAVAIALACGGCHAPHGGALKGDCRRHQEYERAIQVAPLKVPEGLDAPNVQGALVIPAVEGPPPPGPNDACLDEPPRFKGSAPPKPPAG
jgi:uncharacterized lipoprotein